MDHNGNWTGQYGIKSETDFLNSPHVQERTFSNYMGAMKGYVKNVGAFSHIGQQVDGVKAQIILTRNGLMAAAHRKGLDHSTLSKLS